MTDPEFQGYRLDELARRVGGAVRGDAGRLIRGIATLEQAGPEELSFFTNVRYRRAAELTRAGALLVGPGAEGRLAGHDLLEAEAPQAALAALLELFHPSAVAPPGISPDARLAADVRLGPDVSIAPFVVVGARTVLGAGVVIGAGSVVAEDCTVGEATVLGPRVVLYPRTCVGARCRIHAGVVLGGDGFGFAPVGGEHRKVPQVGRVVIEDDVEIGANSAVDRATLGETRIGQGTKIDNLVQVAHGVAIGPHCLLAGQAGVAGSTRLGARATLAGQAGVAGHLELGPGVIVAAKSAVLEDLPPGAFVAGIPARDHRRWKRAQAALDRLPELLRELRDLRRRLERLEHERDQEEA